MDPLTVNDQVLSLAIIQVPIQLDLLVLVGCDRGAPETQRQSNRQPCRAPIRRHVQPPLSFPCWLNLLHLTPDAPRGRRPPGWRRRFSQSPTAVRSSMRARGPSISSMRMHCQVPRTGFPFFSDSVTELPSRTDVRWACALLSM